MRKPLHTFILGLAAVTLLSGVTAKGSEKWTELFNGKDFDGWTIRGGGATYEIRDGAIVGLNGPGHNTFLATWNLYSDFELEFEVKVSNSLNSGVQIRSKARWETVRGKEIETVSGPQVEIAKSPGHAGYLYGERAGGWMTPQEQRIQHSHLKNEDWNHYRIVANGPRIQTWINGNAVSDLVDEERYKDHAEGFIGLQVHSARAETGSLFAAWRNLRIKELNTEGKKWISLFNGKDMDDLTIKVHGYEVGENPGNIFRVENGLLRTSYDQFETFGNHFGHIFFPGSYSNYKFRMEYRFHGEQSANAPAWALRNSGIMAHGQTPQSMGKDQRFPASIEIQLLGGELPVKRTTGNLCTPETHVVYQGELHEKHCTTSSSKTYPWNEWVRIEVHVKGSDEFIHFINGKEVLRYTHPQKEDGTLLDSGTISLQAESHGGEFRNIEIMEL